MGTASHSPPHLSESLVQAFLARLGERYEKPATLYLLGGSALLLLGSPRPTIDIDYLGTDIPSQMEELQLTIRQVADEMHIDVEAIPFQDFIPLPQDAQQRHVSVGQFGKLTAYVFDPYSIALSKIARGFESDLEDVVFLIQRNLVTYERLEQMTRDMLARAADFGLDVQQIRAHLEVLRRIK